MQDESKNNVPALRRAALVLDIVRQTHKKLNTSDIVKQACIPKSTGHGLINVMVELEMLQRDENGIIGLGPRLLEWSNGFLSDIDLLKAFQKISNEHVSLLPYTLTLSVPEKNDVVYIACRNSSLPLGFTFKIGMRLPIVYTATGKAMMAHWHDDHVAALFAQQPWPKALTDHGVPSLVALFDELEKTRQRGFSIDDGQVREGMICLGAVIRDYTQKPVAGLAISMTNHELEIAGIDQIGQEICAAAKEISRLLGG